MTDMTTIEKLVRAEAREQLAAEVRATLQAFRDKMGADFATGLIAHRRPSGVRVPHHDELYASEVLNLLETAVIMSLTPGFEKAAIDAFVQRVEELPSRGA